MKLNFQQYGDTGPALIILHGLLGSHGNWSTLSRHAFSEKYRVFTVDQRNHGLSPHTDAFDYGDLAEDVREFAKGQGLGDVILLGHSMGGKTAMETALSYPDLVSALIVADMAPRAYEPSHQQLLDALGRIEPKEHASRSSVDEALAKDVKSKPVRQFLLKNLIRKNGEYAWQMNQRAISESYEALIGGIEGGREYKGPALFIRGGNSPYVTEDDKEGIVELFPEATCEEVAGAGHWLHADKPEAFADAVMRFLGSTSK